MYDLPGGILLYVRALRKNLSMDEFYSMPTFLGGILIWVRVLCRNLTYETSSLEECYSMYDIPGGILPLCTSSVKKSYSGQDFSKESYP